MAAAEHPATAFPDPGSRPAPRRPTVADRGTVLRAELSAGRWSTGGIAKVEGDATVDRARLRGTVVVGGRLVAGEVRLSGTLDVRGAVAVDQGLRTDGTLLARSTVDVGEADLDGTTRVLGELRARTVLRSRGSLTAPAVRALSVDLAGTAEVPGELAATAVTARFARSARLGTVRGRKVSLRGPVPNPVRWALGLQAEVEVDRIEADRAYLEGVRVAFVRAPEIELGPASHLLAHEGTVLRAHRTSRIGPESWSPAPPGLRR